jgi:hypothetical protein
MPASVRPVPNARPRRGLWKPRGSPKIIRSLAPRGLEICVAPSPEWQDLVRGRPPIINGSPTIGSTPRGLGQLLNGGTQNVAYQIGAANAPGSATGPVGFSIEVLFWESSASTDGGLVGFDTSAAGNGGTGSYMAIDSNFPTGWRFNQYDSSIALQQIGNNSDNTAGKWYHLIGTYDGNTMSFYTNGALSQSAAIGANYVSNHSISDLYLTVGVGRAVRGTAWANGGILLCNYATVSWTAAEVGARYRNPLGFLQWPEDRRHYAVGVAAAASSPSWGYEVEPAFPRRRKPRPLKVNEDPTWPFTATATPTQFGWATPEQFAKRRRPQTVFWQDAPVFPVSIVSLTPTQFGFGWDPQFPIRRKPRNFQPDEPTDQWPFTATKTPTQQGFAWEPQFPVRRKRQVLQPDQPAEMWPFTVTAPTVRVPAIAIPPVPERATGSMEAWVVQIARTLNLVLRGKVNAVTSITLTANATSTTLIDDRIGASTYVALVPLTSSSTAIDIAPYVSARTRGSATIAHGSSPADDLEFSVLLIG